MVSAMNLGLLVKTPPPAFDLNNGLQAYMFSIFTTVKSVSPSYATLNAIYVGYEDGTFIGYFTIPAMSVAWRPADGSPDTNRRTYPYDAVTGKSTAPVGAITNQVYDTRTRAWYKAAKAEGVGVWSPTFTFSIGGQLAISYAVPIYDGVTFKGSTGLDFQLSDVDTILNGYNTPGAGIYIFETELTSATDDIDAYQLLATSSNAPTHNVTSKAQFYAYQREVQDNLIINSANYLKNSGVIANGMYSIDGIDIEVRNYVKYTLEWRYVKYSSTATAAGDAPDSTTTTEDGDDDISTVLAISGAILAVLLVVVIVLIVSIVIFAKGSTSPMASSAKDSNL